MDIEKYREIEEKYRELKEKLERNELNSEELKVSLKKMMIRDDEGNYWMIGSNTGKWYVYNGTDWKEKTPYSSVDLSQTQQFSREENLKDETVFAQKEEATENVTDQNEVREEYKFESEEDQSEVKLEQESIENEDLFQKKEEEEPIVIEKSEEVELSHDEDKGVNCIICKSRLDSHSIYCNFCGANQKELSSKKKRGSDEMIITSIRMTSILFFLGGLGLIFGVILGASFGIFNIMGDLINLFPEMLSETRGKIQGGLIFAAIGGIGGFIVFSLISVAITLIYNTISYLFGGIRIKTQ
ncbi:MAG: hypothetical protein ABFR75_01695 [Acidobacteriota bacterium]